MNETPAEKIDPIVWPKPWKTGLMALAVVLAVVFARPMIETAKVWVNKADYSHGFLIPLVSAYLIYRNRSQIRPEEKWPNAFGLVFFAIAGLGLAAGSLNIAKEACQGIALVSAVTGLVVMFFGWKGLKWSWPAILFLIFMFPLPYTFEQNLAFKLRRVATVAANYILHIFGQPSYIAGNGTIITVGDVKLDVQHACSGLTMLLTFIALSYVYAAICHRSWTDRLLIMIMAVPIAVACNIARIVVTGHVYVWGWKKFGDLIVHDLAGWLMMPLAMAMIWVMLKIVDWITVVPIRIRKEEFIKSNLVTDQYIRVRNSSKKADATKDDLLKSDLLKPKAETLAGSSSSGAES